MASSISGPMILQADSMAVIISLTGRVVDETAKFRPLSRIDSSCWFNVRSDLLITHLYASSIAAKVTPSSCEWPFTLDLTYFAFSSWKSCSHKTGFVRFPAESATGLGASFYVIFTCNECITISTQYPVNTRNVSDTAMVRPCREKD